MAYLHVGMPGTDLIHRLTSAAMDDLFMSDYFTLTSGAPERIDTRVNRFL